MGTSRVHVSGLVAEVVDLLDCVRVQLDLTDPLQHNQLALHLCQLLARRPRVTVVLLFPSEHLQRHNHHCKPEQSISSG